MTVETSNVSALKALADPTRLRIIEFLSQSCCGQAAVRDNGDVEAPTAGEVCCHITGAEKITSTVSHHLHELESAGIIRMERRGKAALCTLRPEILQQISSYLADLAATQANSACCP